MAAQSQAWEAEGRTLSWLIERGGVSASDGTLVAPAAIWLFSQDKTGWGIFMLVWGLLGISSVDNVLRPMLIRMGADLPLLLIFSGVVGGLLAFGLVGIFIGPVVLAVAYRLLEAWTNRVDPA